MLSIFSQFIFGNSGLFRGVGSGSGAGSGGAGCSPSWRDRSLCFDLRTTELELDPGEQLIASFFPIEDVKGNPDDLGVLKVTNLRLMWICCDKKRVNLSIGWRTVSLTFEQNVKNSFGSSVTSLCVLSKFESTKYEFVLNKMPAYDYIWNGQTDEISALAELRQYLKNDKTLTAGYLTPMYLIDPFEVVFNVWQAYKRTHLFRHCRSNLTDLIPSSSSSSNCQQQQQTKPSQVSGLKADQINKLPAEEIIDVYNGIVQIEARLAKYTGTLILTNVRLIWIDDSLLLRNLSIPFIRIESIKMKQSDRMIVNTLDYLATSNQIELRAQRASDPKRARQIFEQVQNLYSLYKSKPKYGPESCDECIEIMSHLRPAENYIESAAVGLSSSSLRLENLGPTPIGGGHNIGWRRRSGATAAAAGAGDKLSSSGLAARHSLSSVAASIDDDDGTADESASMMVAGQSTSDDRHGLMDYCTKLNNYLDEQPVGHDQEMIYSKELGLAIERPMNDTNLERIWRIDL